MKLTSISHIAAALAVIASSAIAAPHPIDHDLTHQQHRPPAPHPIDHNLAHQQHSPPAPYPIHDSEGTLFDVPGKYPHHKLPHFQEHAPAAHQQHPHPAHQQDTLPAHQQPPPPQQHQQSHQRYMNQQQLVQESYRRTAEIHKGAIKSNELAIEDARYAKKFLEIHGYVSHELERKEEAHHDVTKVKKFSERLETYQQGPGDKIMSKSQRRFHRGEASKFRMLAKETSDRAWATLEEITPGISKHATLGRYAYAGNGILPPPEQRG